MFENKSVSTSLLAIQDQYNRIMQVIIENGGELTPELEAALQDIELNRADKVDSYKAVMDKMDVEEILWKERAAEFQTVARACRNVKERLKVNIKALMSSSMVTDVSGNYWRFKLSNSKDSVEITDSREIPAKYCTEKVELVPDKAMILVALQSGEQIDGVVLKKGTSLRSYVMKPKKKEIANDPNRTK